MNKLKNNKLNKIVTFLTLFLLLGQSVIPSIEVLAEEIGNAKQETVNKNEKTEQTTDLVPEETVENSEPPVPESPPSIVTEEETNQNNAPPVVIVDPNAILNEAEAPMPFVENGGLTSSGEEIVYHKVGNVVSTRATGNGTNYLGKYYGGYQTSTAYITIGSEVAWCIEPHKPAPINIQYAEEIYTDEGIYNILYYANEWGWTQANSYYVDVYVALNVYLGAPNFADHPAKLADPNVARLLEKARVKDAPRGKFGFNKTAQNATVKNGRQETDWYTPTTDGKNITYNITVPDDIVKAVTSDGKTLGKGVHTLAQNISFKYVAPLNYAGTVKHDVLTNVRPKSALKFIPHDGTSQKLTKAGTARDPLKVKDVSATFVKRAGNLKIKKIDSKTGAALPGAKFTIEYDGKIVEKIMDANGEAALNDVIADTKGTVKEITAPNGYVINKTPQTFTIVAGQTTTLVFDNTKQVGTARIFKEDSKTGVNAFGPMYSLEGAIYGLYQVNGTLIKEVTLKNINGRVQAEVADLALGDYYWQEIKAPNGYLIDKTKLNFSLTYAGQEHATTLTEVVAKDVAQLGKATIIKEDSETGGTPQGEATLENAVYGVFHENGTKIKSLTLKTVNGKVQASIDGLALGNYYYQEEKAPTGYQLGVPSA